MFRYLVGVLLVSVQWLGASGYIFVSAPNIIRVSNTETVLVTLLGPETERLEVNVTLKNEDQSDICPPQTVTVDPDNPRYVELFINPTNIPLRETPDDVKLYAKLKVSCDDLCDDIPEKDLLISYEGGFVFIQTDKPIYTPEEKVSIRLLILDQYLRPSDQQVQLDILTPHNVTVRRADIQAADKGFETYVFSIPEEPAIGNWSAIVYYGAERRSSQSVQFEVREYTLPTFSVELATPDYLLDGDQTIEISVSARYVYNEPVIGDFHAKIGIVELNGEIDNIQRRSGQLDSEGEGNFDVRTQNFGENWFGDGKRLYVEVSVVERASGISERASDTSTMFVHSPYTFRWDRTVRYFKKRLPYEVMVDLVLSNGKPAKRVPIEVTATCTNEGGDESLTTDEQNKQTTPEGKLDFVLYPSVDCNSIAVLLQTSKRSLVRADGSNHNARLNFTVAPYESPSGKDFLMIRVGQKQITDKATVFVEEWLHIGVFIRRGEDALALPVPYLAYYVVSKGKISEANNVHIGNDIQGFDIFVTYDMAPTARVVAFYVNHNGDVIADSIWIHIQRQCENRLTVGVPGSSRNNVNGFESGYLPDRNIYIGVQGQPGTIVSLLAVDKAVYLLRDNHRLTSDKMFDTMDLYDTGCGPGAGRNSADVFENAGVVVLTNAVLDVNHREAYGCDTPYSHRRRRSTQNELRRQLEGYDDEDEKYACKRGHKLIGAELTCRDRTSRFAARVASRFKAAKLARLRRIFFACCKKAEKLRASASRGRSGGQGGLPEDSLVEDVAEPVQIRKDFKDTWIDSKIEIGSSGLGSMQFTIPSSITEWSVTAVGLSHRYPMCLADPVSILVKKNIFIQLHMPYSVVRKEQVEIVVTVFNYETYARSMDVYIRTPEGICSRGRKNTFSDKKEIDVQGGSAFSVTYVLIGMAVGEFPIEVAIYRPRTSDSLDAVRKMLKVVPEGIETFLEFSSTLDPSGSMRDQSEVEPRAISGFDFEMVVYPDEHKQVDLFNFRLPSTVVPNTEKCKLGIVGTVLGPVVTAVIEGLDSLLEVPSGCGEQTMSALAPNVYIIRYLTSLNAATADLEAKAVSNVNRGIMNEMRFRKLDGSFSVFTHEEISSTWLTAFVNKVFCHANGIDGIHVDHEGIICKAMAWLISNAQRDDGAFHENGRVFHGEMTGGIQGDATLTAFVLISILECECETLNNRRDSISRASAFLEGQVDSIQRPYAMAIVTYALALADSSETGHANDILKSLSYQDVDGLRYWGADGSSLQDDSKPYWYRQRPSAITVETTGYALLAQLAVGDIEYSHSIVKWLSSQQKYGGGFASTQDTTIALQALSEYSILANRDSIDLTCSFLENEEQEVFRFNEDNAMVQQSMQIRPDRIPFNVTTVGTGTGKLNVRVSFNTISTDLDDRQCPFRILINRPESEEVEPEELPPANPPEEPPVQGSKPGRSRIGRVKRQIELDPDDPADNLVISVEVAYRADKQSNMAIIDVGIFSGYQPNKEDLEQILDDNRFISRFEVSHRSVIFYADNIPTVDSGPKLRLEFGIAREHYVSNLSPALVRVYDYYNTTAECKKFYHPTSSDEAASKLANICEGELCVCAAGDCLDCGPNDKITLLTKSCRNAQTYAYKIHIIGRSKEVGFTVFNASIILVLKEADDRRIRLGDTREFWRSNSCPECEIKLRKNSNYLVIGETALEYVNKDKMLSFKYILDDTAAVEFWPNNSPNDKYVDQLNKMIGFQRDIEVGLNDYCG